MLRHVGLILRFGAMVTASASVQSRFPTHPRRVSPQDDQTCLCMKPMGSRTCLPYDSQYQATSMAEAIANFRDRTYQNPSKAPRLDPSEQFSKKTTPSSAISGNYSSHWPRMYGGAGFGGRPIVGVGNVTLMTGSRAAAVEAEKAASQSASAFDCKADEACRRCYGKLLSWFGEAAKDSGDAETSAEVHDLSRTFQIPEIQSSSEDADCLAKFNRGVISPEAQTAASTEKKQETPAADVATASIFAPAAAPGSAGETQGGAATTPRLGAQRFGFATTTETPSSASPSDAPTEETSTNPMDVDNNDDPYASKITVDCRQKGLPVEEEDQWCGLCDVCWRVVRLKPEYFPPYLNELVCGESQRCLGGYGQCRPRFKSLEMMKNYGTKEKADWRPHTLNMPISCDCQLKTDSSLVNLAVS